MEDEIVSTHVLQNRSSEKEKVAMLKLASDIKQQTDQQEVLEERIPHTREDRTSEEALCQLHDVIMDAEKQNIVDPSTSKVNLGSILMNNVSAEDEIHNQSTQRRIGLGQPEMTTRNLLSRLLIMAWRST
jgi:hypothetical protein